MQNMEPSTKFIPEFRFILKHYRKYVVVPLAISILTMILGAEAQLVGLTVLVVFWVLLFTVLYLWFNLYRDALTIHIAPDAFIMNRDSIRKSIRIAWSDIHSIETLGYGSWLIRSPEKKVVFNSHLYPNQIQLLRALEQHLSEHITIPSELRVQAA